MACIGWVIPPHLKPHAIALLGVDLIELFDPASKGERWPLLTVEAILTAKRSRCNGANVAERFDDAIGVTSVGGCYAVHDGR